MVTLDLLKQCTKDNRRAHFELCKLSFACLYKVCKRYYNNDEDIKSALNMVFLKVVTHLDQFVKKEKEIEREKEREKELEKQILLKKIK